LYLQIEATTATTKTKNQIKKMKLIKITDPADKNSKMIFSVVGGKLSPIGIVHCFSATEWKAFDAAGNFINWFESEKQATAALA
jgi:hypothetical protein